MFEKLLQLDGSYAFSILIANKKVVSIQTDKVGVITGDDCIEKMYSKLNTIELDAMMDETDESDDFHKRKY